ncbi:zinc finger CCCH domain-containing protein 64 [Nicotiana sylvestris]|uniref:Zinc finger CCCH domain-containing protein 64 isoform X1 n=2 Tax=Nicotiana sylvestris TaxID=4096 RepID=A0A1U7Y5C0_NICSY|nr:PREDICTED: zinc finger CCCH domain-containing protein 64 isoform X1 [Nicotiana sylvestris]
MAPLRILLCGDVLGRLNQLFKRVSSVNKSAGPFDALFCVGQFFPDSIEGLEEFNGYIEGSSKIPIPTYFIGDYGVGSPKILSAVLKDPSNQGFKMEGFRVCDNLFWLKGSGKFELHGLSVAYLSGRRSPTGAQFGTYSQDDVDALRALAEDPGTVDIFLTNEWPSGVTNGVTSNVPSEISDSSGSDPTVSELVAEIKPRYHVAGTMGAYFDRQPYANVDALHVTRFLGLAPVGNKDKQKFIHAISPTPASTMSKTELRAKPPNTTLSPYTIVGKAAPHDGATKRSGDSTPESQYWRYDVSQKRQKHGDGNGDRLCFKFVSSGSCPREKCHFRHDEEAMQQYSSGVCFDFLNKGKCERGPDCNFKHSLQEEGGRSASGAANSNRSRECWFCLSSPNVESHLITSVGEYYYCALAKGPLLPDHALIMPIEHTPNTLSLPQECEKELERLQNSFRAYFKKQGKEAIFFEWVFKRGSHANLQVVPIPSSRASLVQDIFNLAAEKLGFKFTIIKEGRQALRTQFDRSCSLFYVEVPGGGILSHVVEENEKFPAQFGREVLAGLLNVADRADWRNCKDSKEEEIKMVERFKSGFQEYDPNQ